MAKVKALNNVGVLDLREATEESISGINKVSNVGIVLLSPETANLLSRIPKVQNLGVTLQVSKSAKLFNGQKILTRDSFKDQSDALQIVANGQIIFNPDIPLEDVQKGLGDLWINGQILYPEHLAGAVEGKLRSVNGQSVSYMDCSTLVVGNLNLDLAYLKSLGEGSELTVIGNLRAFDVLDNDEVSKRISKIQVIGSVMCREENAEALLGRLYRKGASSKVKTIPSGYEFVKSSIVIDEETLGALPGRKIYCTGSVRIEKNVTAKALDKLLDSLIIGADLICPTSLREVVSRKCNILEITSIFYEGELWLEEGKTTIHPSRFEYLEGNATLVVRGKVTMDEKIELQTLVERLEKVHIFGRIICSAEQKGVIESKLGIKKGVLSETTTKKRDQERKAEESVLSNIGSLRL